MKITLSEDDTRDLTVDQFNQVKELVDSFKGWEPEAYKDNYWVDCGGYINKSRTSSSTVRLLGNEHKTREEAEVRNEQIRKGNLIYRRACELCGGVPEGEWSVYLSRSGEYRDSLSPDFGAPSMPEDVARQIAEELNSRYIKL